MEVGRHGQIGLNVIKVQMEIRQDQEIVIILKGNMVEKIALVWI